VTTHVMKSDTIDRYAALVQGAGARVLAELTEGSMFLRHDTEIACTEGGTSS